MGAPFDVSSLRTLVQNPPKDPTVHPFENEFGPNRERPSADSTLIVAGCPTIRWAVENPASVPEPYWRDIGGIGRFCTDGEAWFHQISKDHPDYDPTETQAKFDGWNGTGATTCAKLAEHNPHECGQCAHRSEIKSPIALGTRGKDEPVPSPSRLTLEAGLLVLSSMPPPTRLWTVQKLMALGKYAVLAGLGGVSKTMLAIVWAVHTAMGRPWAGLEVREGAALLFLGEEDAQEAVARVGACCRDFDDVERHQVEKRLLVYPWAGKDMRLTRLRDGNPTETDLAEQIVNIAKIQAERCSIAVTLIVIDHARLVIGGDPNDAQHVTEVTRVLTKIAEATAAAVLLIAHSPKAAMENAKKGEDSNASHVAGSIAWVDNSRAAMVLTGMRADEAKKYGFDSDMRHRFAKLALVKANYARTGWECWVQRQEVANWGVSIPTHIDLKMPTKINADAGLDARVIALVNEMPGSLSRRKLRDHYSGKTGRLGAPERDVEVALDRMIRDGKLLTRCPTEKERELYGLTHQTKAVLEVAK